LEETTWNKLHHRNPDNTYYVKCPLAGGGGILCRPHYKPHSLFRSNRALILHTTEAQVSDKHKQSLRVGYNMVYG